MGKRIFLFHEELFMKLPIFHRINTFKPIALLLLILLLIIPLTSHATAYLYTYTSDPLTETMGTLIPPLPVIGDQLKIQFTLNTDQQQAWDSNPLTPYEIPVTMTVGPYTIMTPPDDYGKIAWGGCLMAVSISTIGDLPWAGWDIQLVVPPTSMPYIQQITMASDWSVGVVPSGLGSDYFTIRYADGSYFSLSDQSHVGTWTCTPIPSPVPEPTTLILFGTGLAGLAATVKRKRS